MKVSDLMDSLREVAHSEPAMAAHLWVLVFPIVWATLAEKKEQQVTLAKPIINLLSKEWHHRQASNRPNVIQALLEGISLSQPQPKIPSELIKFLGKAFNAWHIAIPLLESHVMLFPMVTSLFPVPCLGCDARGSVMLQCEVIENSNGEDSTCGTLVW